MNFDIVVIDTGVCYKHPFFSRNNMYSGISVFVKDHEINFTDCFDDYDGHGTAVNAIIDRYTSYAKIYNIKIIDSQSCEIDEETLIKTLNYIYNEINCKVLLLSCGIESCDNKHILEEICIKLKSKGIFIVSAFASYGSITYPAAFECVIGVDIHNDIRRLNDYIFIENGIINIIGASIYQNLPNIHENISKKMIGTSFVAPFFASKILNLLKATNNNNDYVLRQLKNDALYSFSDTQLKSNCMKMKIRKAVIVPFNKEMHSMVKFIDLLSFDIYEIYETKYSGNVGKNIREILPHIHSNSLTIKNIENLLITNPSFDTIIMGHMDEITKCTGIDYPGRIYEYCVDNNIQLYSFDNIEPVEKKIEYYSPNIMLNAFGKFRYGKLRRISKPILSILGTSSQQGKFTLQLELRSRFLHGGYHVGQIGTEPTSPLFGMNYTFPFGHNNKISLTDEEFVQYLNELMYLVELENPDIIITGSQSQTLNPAWGNLSFYPLMQHLFLLAVEPDIIILCINIDDDHDYISRTLSYIKAVTNAKIIALVIFPIAKYNGMKKNFATQNNIEQNNINTKNNLTSKFELNVYELNKCDDMAALYESCILTLTR